MLLLQANNLFANIDFGLIMLAVLLIIGTLLIIFFVKRIIVNSILGVVAWVLIYYFLGIKLPFLVSLVVSVIFGLAGIGVLLLLKVMGII